MKKARNIALIVFAVAILASMSVYAFANAPEKGSMGVWGYVASDKQARLEVADQIGADTLVVDAAAAPDDAWIVVHTDDDGMPGERVGLARIEKGENTDIPVKLEDLKSENVIVAIHADKGTAETFEFDMEDKERSPDRPYFVDGMELAMVVAVREFGVKAEAGAAGIDVADQPVADGTLTVAKAAAPTPAWVVVHLNDDGMPGERVGLAQIQAGESTDILVQIDSSADLSGGVLVAVHADRGTPGAFDFDMDDKLNSADQPFFVDGEEVATAVEIQ